MAIEDMGFRLVEGAYSPTKRETWYEKLSGNDEVTFYAKLEVKTGQRSHAWCYGAVVPVARHWLREHRPTIDRYLNPMLAEARWGAWLRVCWTVFDVGRILDWPLFSIPNPLNREMLDKQIEEARNEVFEPAFREITNSVHVRNLYLRDDGGYGWDGGNAALRLCEVVAMSILEGRSMEDTCVCVEPFRRIVSMHMKQGESFDAFIEDLFRVA